MAELSSDADLTVHVDQLRTLAGDLRRAAAGLEVALARLGGGKPGGGKPGDGGGGAGAGVGGSSGVVPGDAASAGSAALAEACGHYVEVCRRGLRELRDGVADVAGGLDATAADYAEYERGLCASFQRLGAAMPDPVVEAWPR
ncbi:MAG TPA: hypothetical protein VH008_17345 [Pseudonocardia sp.]|nr:hypothetical protein [Pseudonocardia sp.]